MARVLKRPVAERDLSEIWSFIAEDDPDRATQYLRRLNGALEKLAQSPLMGRLRPEIGARIRSFPVDDYLTFYVPLEDGVDVIRFVHGSRDLSRLF